jgi:serine/threonine protein kinase
MSTSTKDVRPKLSGMKYLVEAVLSADGSSTVLRIGDRQAIGQTYALKIIKRESTDDDLFIELGRLAAEASSKLSHPSILKYHDFRLRRSWFRVSRGELLMEYVAGQPIAQLEEETTTDHLILIYRQVASALAHMHRRGVRHGDLRPEHVLLSQSGAVKVIGYGLSMLEGEFKEAMPGSKKYMAPEQIRARIVTDKSDVYSFGASFYHSVTGKPANVGLRTKGDVEKITLPSRLNPAIPAALNDLLVHCLQSHPPNRPDGMFEIQQRLDDLAKQRGLEDQILKGLATSPSD